MAQIISIVNQKGGVGKTTTAINLGAYLARLGKFVLLVDLDPQANATSGLGINHRELNKTIYHALTGETPINELILKTPIDGYSIIPSNADLAGANVELFSVANRENILREALLPIRNNFDVILIDCPPSLGVLTINGLVAADKILIPVQAEYYALEGLGQLIGTINLIKENIKPELDILGAVMTMYDGRVSLSSAVLEELYKHFPNKIFRSVIPRSVRLAEAPSFGKTIFEYEPNGKAAKAYERLAREFIEILGR